MYHCAKGSFGLEGEAPRAARLLNELDRTRRVWAGFHPGPDMRRSDMGVLNAMMHLSEGGQLPVTVGVLARHLHQSMPATSQKLGELERQGCLRREVNPGDRRKVGVTLTPKGVGCAQESMRGFFSKIEKAMERLGPEKSEELIGLLRQLSDAIEAVKDNEESDADAETEAVL